MIFQTHSFPKILFGGFYQKSPPSKWEIFILAKYNNGENPFSDSMSAACIKMEMRVKLNIHRRI
jgi:hypothetical protein